MSATESYSHQVMMAHSSNSFVCAPPTIASWSAPAFVDRRRVKHHHFTHKQQQSLATRLFGCNPKSPNAKPGEILLEDDRLNSNDGYDCDDSSISPTSVLPINLTALRQTIQHTREIIGYPTFDISVTLVTTTHMREINYMSRGINASTDVLSFCFQDEDDIIEPGTLGDVQFDLPDFYNLGDVLIDVEYVQRRCEEDYRRSLHSSTESYSAATAATAADKKKDGANNINRGANDDNVIEGEVIAEQSSHGIDNDDDDTSSSSAAGQKHQQQQLSDNVEEEYEYIEIEVDEYDDRGVAPQMQHIYDPEIRIHMLLVHGMLHLVGYDHIEEDDYELMVVKEDEVLAELRRRLGNNFGVVNGRALPEK